jgi:hypothetical protein
MIEAPAEASPEVDGAEQPEQPGQPEQPEQPEQDGLTLRQRAKRAKLAEAEVAKAKRGPFDDYPTPMEFAEPITNAALWLASQRVEQIKTVIEPSCGDGTFLRAIVAEGQATAHLKLLGIEIREEAAQEARDLLGTKAMIITGDWEEIAGSLEMDPPTHQAPRPWLILGNPPYSMAEEHVRAALAAMHDGDILAFLLRLSFLGSQKRAEGLWAQPGLKHLIPLAQRPSFMKSAKGSSTDASEYGVFVWQKGWVSAPTLLPHLWKDGMIGGGS